MSTDYLLSKDDSSYVQADEVVSALGNIFVNDRWIWQLNDESNQTNSSKPESCTVFSLESSDARSLAFKGFLGRFASLFKSLAGGSDAVNLTRARVLATSLFISLGDRNNVAWRPAVKCAVSFQELYVNSSSSRSRRAFLHHHKAFTMVLLNLNHWIIVNTATHIALRRYHYVLTRKSSVGFRALRESIGNTKNRLDNPRQSCNRMRDTKQNSPKPCGNTPALFVARMATYHLLNIASMLRNPSNRSRVGQDL